MNCGVGFGLFLIAGRLGAGHFKLELHTHTQETRKISKAPLARQQYFSTEHRRDLLYLSGASSTQQRARPIIGQGGRHNGSRLAIRVPTVRHKRPERNHRRIHRVKCVALGCALNGNQFCYCCCRRLSSTHTSCAEASQWAAMSTQLANIFT